MEKSIELLIGLQNCDTRIEDIRRRQKEGPIEIQRLENNLRTMKSELEKELNHLEAYARERRRIEQDIDEVESRMKKSDEKLSSIKSNKEYQAALKEIDDLKVEKSLLEDKVLEIMEEIETFEERHAANKAKSIEFEEKLEKDRNAILKQLEVLEHDLEGLENEKARFCQAIDVDQLNRYNALKAHKGGLAVSPVIKGVCQTCHMGIPPQRFNELIRGQEILTCPNCNRIIYWGEDELFSKGL